MFVLREINQVEREMLGYLEWCLNIPGEDLVKLGGSTVVKAVVEMGVETVGMDGGAASNCVLLLALVVLVHHRMIRSAR